MPMGQWPAYQGQNPPPAQGAYSMQQGYINKNLDFLK